MRAFLIEAVPAGTLGPLAISLEVLLAVIAQDVVFARNIEDLARLGVLQHLASVSNSLGFDS
jgi:hypothetical protein